MKITNEMIHKVLSQFNLLFNMKYKTDINTIQKSFSYCHSQTTFYDSEYYEMITCAPNIKVESNGDIYYISNNNQSNNETLYELKTFYDSFLLFYQKLSNRQFSVRNKAEFITQIGNCLIKQTYDLLRFIKYLWLSIQLYYPNIDKISSDLIERYDLSLYDINKRCYNEEDFELHHAVFEGNLRIIRKICARETVDKHIYCEINEIDPFGNTPLILAIKLGNYDVIQVLCDHEANVNLKSYKDSLSPMEIALELQDKKMLKILLNAKTKHKLNKWEKNKDQILDLIQSIPDFTFDLKLNFDSNILSVFSSLTACDYYKISKGNGDMRIDMNISSINNLKGQTSILIKAKEKKIYKIDHQTKKSFDYIDHLFSSKDKDDRIKKMIKDGLSYTRVFAENVKLLPIQSSKQTILNFNCQSYQSKGFVYIEKELFKPDLSINLSHESLILNKSEFTSFHCYFQKGLDIINDQSRKKSSRTTINFTKFKRSDSNNNVERNQYMTTEYDTNHSATYNTKARYLKIKKKKIDMSASLCNEFPLTLAHFLPLIHILSFASSEFSQLESTIISNKILPSNVFPLKISFPLGMSFQALLSVVGFSHKKPGNNVFEVNYMSSSNLTSPYQKTIEQQPLIFNTDFYENYYKEKNIQSKSNKNEVSLSNNDNHSDYSESLLQIRENFLTNADEDNEYNKYTNIILLSNRNKTESNDCESQRIKTEVPIEMPNNPFTQQNNIFLPSTPKRSSRSGNKPDLERQKTLKCDMHIKIPKELLIYRMSARKIKETKKKEMIVHNNNRTVDNSFGCFIF